MNLTDLFSRGATTLPQIALVIFLVVFAAIVVRTVRRPASEVRRQARLPLGEHEEQSETEASP